MQRFIFAALLLGFAPAALAQVGNEVEPNGTSPQATPVTCGGVVFPFIGFSRTLAGGSIPLPVDLGALGAPGCVVEVDPLALTAILTDATGGAQWAFSLPQNASLTGVVFAQQAFVLDPAANALGLTITNAGHGLVTNVR